MSLTLDRKLEGPAALGRGIAMSADSELRTKLAVGMIGRLGMIVLVEGRDAGANRRAREVVEQAIADVERNMSEFEKPVEAGPGLLVVTAKNRSEESWTLWSLGIEDESVEAPIVAVVFGRGRRLGGLIPAVELDRAALYRRLALLGRSCECDLDRDWLYGHPLYLRWNEERRREAAASLTFDPEDPMVKAEIARIIDRGPGSGGGDLPSAGGDIEDILLGYREQVIDPSSESAETPVAQAVAEPMTTDAVNAPSPSLTEDTAEPEPPSASEVFRGPLFAVAILVAVLGLGIFVVLSRSKGNS